MFKSMRKDIRFILDHDPAARNTLEVILCYPGLHAVWSYRVNHRLWNNGLKTLARFLAIVTRFFTGVDIHPAVCLGEGVFIDHAMGIVIGETVEIGNNVTIYQGVTLGGTSLEKGKRHPTIEDDVVIGSGAKVLGPITIGKGSRIGANAVVLKSTPPNSVVVGVPGQIILRSQSKSAKGKDLRSDEYPDALGVSLVSVLQRLEKLENMNEAPLKDARIIHTPIREGVWNGEDFMI